MPLTNISYVPHNFTKTLLCIDSMEEHAITGKFLNCYLPSFQTFKSLDEFIFELERFFDTYSIPAATTENRSFQEEKERITSPKAFPKPIKYKDDSIFELNRGKMATFIIKVTSRRSSTWQGDIVWAEKNKSEKFSSVTELLTLIQNVLLLYQ